MFCTMSTWKLQLIWLPIKNSVVKIVLMILCGVSIYSLDIKDSCRLQLSLRLIINLAWHTSYQYNNLELPFLADSLLKHSNCDKVVAVWVVNGHGRVIPKSLIRLLEGWQPRNSVVFYWRRNAKTSWRTLRGRWRGCRERRQSLRHDAPPWQWMWRRPRLTPRPFRPSVSPSSKR